MSHSDAEPVPEGDAAWSGEYWPPVPDAVDLVVETMTMMSVFAAERWGRIHAMRRELLAEAAGRDAGTRELVERSMRLELAAAMRITEYAAGRLIVQAEALVERYPDVLDALSRGRITERHAEIFVDLVDQVAPEVRPQVAESGLALAEAEPVGSFRRALQHAIAAAEWSTLEDRHAEAVRQRRVWAEPTTDGMAVLQLHHPAVEVHAIHGRITAMAKAIAATPGETRTLDQIRADVAADLLLDGTTTHIPAAASGVRASVVVTVPALSLLDDEAAATAEAPTVEGVGPIPMSRARSLCGGDSTWMRVLTHPETGMVLSVGRDRYTPPAALRKLVKWRADRCMAPGCGVPASRCEIDHNVRWTDGGETSLANHAPFCKGHHLVKDNSDWRVRQLPGSGGAIEWTSPTGRRYVVQPERRVPVFRTRSEPTAEPAAPF